MRAFALKAGRGTRVGWVVYALIALLFGLYLGINQIIGLNGHEYFAAWKPLTWEISSVIVIFAMIPGVVRLERVYPVDLKPRWRPLAAHAVGSLVFCAIHVVFILGLRKWVYSLAGETYHFDSLTWQAVYEYQKDLITYIIILVAIFAYRQFQVRRIGELRAAELAAELSQARLKHLTAQIEPHFLFNALNAISNRMHEDVDAADRMISELGSLLRAAYDTDNQVLVPLSSELQWLRGYAAMMTERFRGQLDFELHVPEGLGALKVPRLLLQPLVENALRHGLPQGRGTLRVDVERLVDRLRYVVSDDGVGVKDVQIQFGTGLSNVARRLELLFPGDHDFALRAREPQGAVATVSFPVAP